MVRRSMNQAPMGTEITFKLAISAISVDLIILIYCGMYTLYSILCFIVVYLRTNSSLVVKPCNNPTLGVCYSDSNMTFYKI